MDEITIDRMEKAIIRLVGSLFTQKVLTIKVSKFIGNTWLTTIFFLGYSIIVFRIRQP